MTSARTAALAPRLPRRRRRARRQLLAAASRTAQEAQAAGRTEAAPRAARQPARRADARFLDPHRRGRRDHGLHRQGRARPGHQDRAHPGRGRGARRRARARSSSSPPTRRARRTRATPPAASRCRTARTAILHAAAQVREHSARQPRRSGSASPPTARAEQRRGHRANDGRSVSYGELVAGRDAARRGAAANRTLRDPKTCAVIGKSMPRVDIPAKVTGGVAYVQDLRLPAWCTRASCGRRATARGCERRCTAQSRRCRASSRSCATAASSRSSPSASTRRCGRCARSAEAASWDETRDAAAPSRPLRLRFQRCRRRTRRSSPRQRSRDRRRRDQTLTLHRRPYQMHASIGPSCAVALAKDGDADASGRTRRASIPLRDAIAEMLRMPPERVRCIHMEGSGCYGHNGADDAAADAALIASRCSGPAGARAMDARGRARVGAVRLGHGLARRARGSTRAARSPTGSTRSGATRTSTRPGGAGQSARRRGIIATPFAPPPPKPMPQPAGGGDRNAIPLYTFPNTRVVHHFVPDMPLRVSALRALGAYTTCSRSRASWTSSPARPAPIRSSSGCATSRIRARAT